jgi:hypothetical protein
MRRFAEKWRGREPELTASMAEKARHVRARIERFRPVRPSDRVLEVGSGGCGITPASARSLLRIVEETTDLEAARMEAEETPPRHVGDRLKRLFFKNATWEVFALRDPD